MDIDRTPPGPQEGVWTAFLLLGTPSKVRGRTVPDKVFDMQRQHSIEPDSWLSSGFSGNIFTLQIEGKNLGPQVMAT